jgi:hypothetical protein
MRINELGWRQTPLTSLSRRGRIILKLLFNVFNEKKDKWAHWKAAFLILDIYTYQIPWYAPFSPSFIPLWPKSLVNSRLQYAMIFDHSVSVSRCLTICIEHYYIHVVVDIMQLHENCLYYVQWKT